MMKKTTICALILVGCSSGTMVTPTDGGGGGDGGGEGGTATVQKMEMEPNNDIMSAQDLGTFNDSTTIVVKGDLSSGGNDGMKYTGDWDVYSLTLGAAGSMDVSVDWTANADVDVGLYDANQKQVGGDGTTAKPAKGVVGNANGKYFIGIFSKDNATPYTLTIRYTKGMASGSMCPTTPVQPAMWSGGCNMDVTTAVCSTGDLTNGKVFELDWTTNTTFCEGPHKVQIGGDPPSSWTQGNATEISISTQNPNARAGMTRNIGGYLNINAQDLAGLTSPSGLYYYRVTSFYGSASEVRAFKVIQ